MEQTADMLHEYQPTNYIERSGFWRRFWAYCIDVLIASILALILGIMLPIKEDSSSSLSNFFKPKRTYSTSTITTYSSNRSPYTTKGNNINYDTPDSASLFMLLFGLTELFTGASLGKRMLRLHIKNVSGDEATRSQYFVRWILKYSYFIFALLAVLTGFFLWPILKFCAAFTLFFGCLFVFAEDRQSFHDMASKTTVYRI